jgi:3-oxoadipate enol-lactonase
MLSYRLFASSVRAENTIVLLHAFPLSSAMWEGAVASLQLLRDDVEIVLVDLPGYGESDVRVGWSMSEAAEAVREVIQSVTKNKVILGGLSMGGYVAFEFYRQFGAMLKGLILCDTKAEEDTEAQKRLRTQFAADAMKRGAPAAIERLYNGFVSEHTEPEIAVAITSWMEDAKPEAISAALLAMRDRADSVDLLPLISLPVLVVVGEHDSTCTPTAMRDMSAKIANSSFAEISGARHLSAVEAPDEWAEIVSSFLDRFSA